MDASTVEGPDIMTEGCLRVTAAGWQRLSASDHPSSSGRCFVAMSFDHSMDAAYENGIRPAVEDDAKYEACRVDRVHHLEKICDKIVNEIRRSQFIVADVSQHKPGVYFEAGFAMALNRPVIWTCREEDFDLIHFDTRQYNHIKWTTPEDLRQQLADRILATIGRRLPN
jgi:nucleoside 2-deoxyribosyltransferase